MVVENLVRSRVNFRLAIAVSETDLAGVVAEKDRAVVTVVNGILVVVGRPLLRGMKAGELNVVVDSSGIGVVVDRFFCTLSDGRWAVGRY